MNERYKERQEMNEFYTERQQKKEFDDTYLTLERHRIEVDIHDEWKVCGITFSILFAYGCIVFLLLSLFSE